MFLWLVDWALNIYIFYIIWKWCTGTQPAVTIDNSSDFTMASGFVKIAMEEFYAHNNNNWTGLIQRYWSIVEAELAGKIFIYNINK